MATRGLEKGDHPGLGWIAGDVAAIEPGDPDLKIPHMGWNTLELGAPAPAARRHPDRRQRAARLFRPFLSPRMPRDPDDLVASPTMAARSTAVVARDNIAGTQFHPEKSQALGLALIANFL